MKNKKIYPIIIALLVIVGMMPALINFKSVWCFDDYNGDGVISGEEKDRWAQEHGFSSNADMGAAMADPERWAAILAETDKQYGETNTQYSSAPSSKKEEHVHSYTATVTKDATCTEAGEMTYKCSCGDTYTEVIAMKSHDYESTVTKEPTCTEVGTQTQVCKNCGDTIETNIPALGHKPGDWVTEKEATCSEEGRNVRYCTVCGDPVETMMVDKLPHTEGEWEITQKATLTKPGLKVIKCTECGEILQEEEIPANTTLLYILIGAGIAVIIGIIVGIMVYKRRR